MSITFSCVKCSKQFRVGDELAGKKGKCPKCNTIFQIPRTSQALKKKPKPAAPPPDTGDPFAVIGPETVFASDFVSGEGAPPPRRSPSSSGGGGVWISITFLLVLLASGATAGFIYKDFFVAPPGVDRDLRYLPEECRLLLSVNVDAILASAAYERVKEETKARLDIEKSFEEAAKIVALADIRRLTIGVSAADKYPAIGVLRLNKAVDIAEVKATIAERATPLKKVDFKEMTAGRFTMHVDDQQALCQVGEKTLVFGEVEALRSVLERAEPHKLSPTMQAAFHKVDFARSAVALVMDAQPIVEEARNQGAVDPQLKSYTENLDSVEAVKKVEAVVLTIDLADDITVSATVMCQDPATAEQFKNGLGATLTALKAWKDIPKELGPLLAKADATTKGKSVTVIVSTPVDTLLGLGSSVVNEMK